LTQSWIEYRRFVRVLSVEEDKRFVSLLLRGQRSRAVYKEGFWFYRQELDSIEKKSEELEYSPFFPLNAKMVNEVVDFSSDGRCMTLCWVVLKYF
jgi:hypothetical protein